MNQVLDHAGMIRGAQVSHQTPLPRYLRSATAEQLYAAVPILERLTVARPKRGESPHDYYNRLRASETPEDAVTLAAFAPRPQLAIWWAHETLRLIPSALSENDARLLEHIGTWVAKPNTQLRHWIMRRALFANRNSSTVQLGLAVGWSGGSIAPNDPQGVSRHRCPAAINKAVHAMLAKTRTADRPLLRNHILDLAECLFRDY